MSHEINPVDGGTTLEDDVRVAIKEERERCELIDGEWTPKHPTEMPPDDDRPGCELIEGEWVEKSTSNAAG